MLVSTMIKATRTRALFFLSVSLGRCKRSAASKGGDACWNYQQRLRKKSYGQTHENNERFH